ncbi:MAG: hypothetical protein Q9166_005999, partial [cf. Caloplaca sp. 2 TL-2023]
SSSSKFLFIFAAKFKYRNSQYITFKASATAEDHVAESPPVDLTDPAQVGDLLGQPIIPQEVSGTQQLYGQYCHTAGKSKDPRKGLQSLIPGNNYDHRYLNGFDDRPMDASSSQATSSQSAKKYEHSPSSATDFDASVYERDFNFKDTLSVDEALTQVPLEPSFMYDKPVFILTGQQDAIFCGNGSRELGIPDCGSGLQSQLVAVKALYPAMPAESFDTFIQPNAEHCNALHSSAPEGFDTAHAWLAAVAL